MIGIVSIFCFHIFLDRILASALKLDYVSVELLHPIRLVTPLSAAILYLPLRFLVLLPFAGFLSFSLVSVLRVLALFSPVPPGLLADDLRCFCNVQAKHFKSFFTECQDLFFKM